MSCDRSYEAVDNSGHAKVRPVHKHARPHFSEASMLVSKLWPGARPLRPTPRLLPQSSIPTHITTPWVPPSDTLNPLFRWHWARQTLRSAFRNFQWPNSPEVPFTSMTKISEIRTSRRHICHSVANTSAPNTNDSPNWAKKSTVLTKVDSYGRFKGMKIKIWTISNEVDSPPGMPGMTQRISTTFSVQCATPLRRGGRGESRENLLKYVRAQGFDRF